MIVDIGHHRVDHFGIHVPHVIAGPRLDAAQVTLSQRGIDPENAAVAHSIPHQFPLLIGLPGPEQQFADPYMGIRSIPQVERFMEIHGHGFDIPHGHDCIRLKQEQIPAASLSHRQGMECIRRDDQDFSLTNLVDFILNGVCHHTFQRQENFHRRMVMGFIPPRNIRIPDTDR